MSDPTPRFARTAVQRWRRDVFRIIQEMDPRWPPACPSFSVALILTAISGFGTDVSVLVELTGFSAPYITKVLKRLRKARVVVGQSLRVGWDNDGLLGVVAFAADALTGMGLVTRSPVKRTVTRKVAAAASTPPPTRRPRVTVPAGAVFSPKQVRSNPRYMAIKDRSTADALREDD